MKPFRPALALSAITSLDPLFEGLLKTLRRFYPEGLDAELPKEGVEYFNEKFRLSELRSDCAEMGLVCSIDTIDKLIHPETLTLGKLRDLVSELHGRLGAEMKGTFLLAMTLSEAERYTNPLKGWERVAVRFGMTIADIEESNKCFALSRYSAAVYHVLQVVEAGLIELGKLIGVTDPKSGWTAVTKKLKEIVDKGYGGRSEFEKRHTSFLEQTYTTTVALKDSWRNKVDHVQGRLKLMNADFSQEIAEEILMASRSFMRRLATEMPNLDEMDAGE